MCADVVRKWDRAGRVEAVPYQDEARRRPTGVAAEWARRALYLVAPDGRRWRGAEAAARTLELLPLGKPAGRFLRLPGVRAVARAVYRWVADHRSLVSSLPGLSRPPRREHEE